MVSFLLMNLRLLKLIFPVLDDFSSYHTVARMYIQVSLKFVHILITHNISTFLLKLKLFAVDWSFSTLLRLATILAFLILLSGNIHKNPGPLSFCHWNLGGLPTDNFSKKFLLQAFLSVNDFDIVILGETHLTTNTTDYEQTTDYDYKFERCDHPGDYSRGGIGVYHKSTLPCIFKPELTKLNETLIFQVKVGGKKCFFTCVYRNPSSDNNLKENVDDFANELNSTLENIKGKIPYINFVIGDFNAKNTAWWGDFTDYPGGIISNQPTHFYPGKNPCCIDVNFCTQINLISESGVLPSLLPQCHHDIIYAKIDLHVSLLSPI